MKMKYLFVVACLFLGLSSSSSAQKASDLSLEIPKGKALIYIYRPAFPGAIINMKTYCDDELIGTTRGKQFLYAFVDPGKHTLTSKASNLDVLDISVEAGETYYVHQRATAGLGYAGTRLDVHDEVKSLRKLKRCRLAKRFEANSYSD